MSLEISSLRPNATADGVVNGVVSVTNTGSSATTGSVNVTVEIPSGETFSALDRTVTVEQSKTLPLSTDPIEATTALQATVRASTPSDSTSETIRISENTEGIDVSQQQPTSTTSGGVALEDLGTVTPTIKTPDYYEGDPITFQPPVVTRIGFTVPWNANTLMDEQGNARTFTTNSDADRFVIEGIFFLRQLDTLRELQRETDDVKVITDAYKGTVSFDQFKCDRKAETERGTYTYQGNVVRSPLYTFQLQSRQSEENNGLLDALAGE